LPENRSFTVTESARRREMLLAALVAALPIELAETASATPLNPEQTIIRLPAQLQWKSNPSWSLLHPSALVAGLHERATPL
jgi:hypothetical protein